MLIVLNQGGLNPGGLNFDAKLRRASTDIDDLFHAHIGGMDTFARALLIADRILEDGAFEDFIAERYSGFDSDIGKRIETGDITLSGLSDFALGKNEPKLRSGRQEYLENMLNQYIFSTE
jgi:xylose isomerase